MNRTAHIPLLSVQEVSLSRGGQPVLHPFSLEVEKGRRIAIAGETGSGKTTLLKIMGGWEQADTGTVWLNGQRVYGTSEKLLPGHKGIAYHSQHFELRNHYRVNELLQYAQEVDEATALRIYTVCRISHLLNRWSHELSGGERQRVSLARHLLSAPQLLLLDEPFSNLDWIHRQVMKEVIEDLSAVMDMTIILVAHDPVDLLSWPEEILLLKEGQLVQRGHPAQLYRHPVNAYAAALLGSYTELRSDHLQNWWGVKKEQATVFIRPEQIIEDAASPVKATLLQSRFYGTHYEWDVEVEGIRLIMSAREEGQPGAVIGLMYKS